MMSLSFSNEEQLLDHLRGLGVKVQAEGGQLRCSGPKGVLTPALRAQIATCKPGLLRLLRQDKASQSDSLSIPALKRPAQFPASFAQQRLWFLDRLDPNLSVYNIASIYRLTGELNIRALEQSLQEIVRRHESLRTNLVAGEEGPRQIIKDSYRLEVPLIDLRYLPPAKREETVFRLAKEEIAKPFDLAQDLMLRVKLFCLDDASYILVITMHHVASDGWSSAIFWKELTALYAANCASEPSPLPELAIQYADFAVWQRSWLQDEVLERELDYWRTQLAGLQRLDLPTDYPRPAINSYQGAAERFEIPATLTARIGDAARREGVTLYMLLLAAFNVMLYRYTGQEDIVVGSLIANRNLRDIEELIGFFVNTLVMRTNLDENPSFRELLHRVREVALDAYDHQDLPFEKLVEELQPERDLSRHPLFQVLFVLQTASPTSLDLNGLAVEQVRVTVNETSKFDLMLNMSTREDRLGGFFEYRTDLFDALTIRRMIGHYQNLLSAVSEDPDCRISQLPMLSESELQELLVAWNNTAVPYPRASTIDALFEVQARRTPQAEAIYFEGQTLTYSELNQRANQIAHFLIEQGVQPGELVGMALERSLDLVVAMLAILKAGAAYLPLDTEYPGERIQWMLEDAHCRCVVTHKTLQVPALPNTKILYLDSETVAAAIKRQSWEDPRCTGDDSSTRPAYVMFTSGSSGRPKGVMVPHRGVVRLVKHTNYADLGPEQRLLQFAPIGFDASTFEIWGPLLNGGQLFIFPHGQASLAELAGYLRTREITTLWLTAGLFHLMVEHELEALAGIPQVLSGGDVVSAQHVQRLLQASSICRFTNCYGPTENTTFTTYFSPSKEEVKEILAIGRPINNTTVYILDANMEPVPIGVPGEIYAGGDGLALGYLNHPELTEAAFVPNPFSSDRRSRLYRTGDRARYLPDGNIEFMGRADRQVKIRGYRIEPGEIESHLERHEAVQQAAVTVRENEAGDKKLLAYAVPMPGRNPQARELKSFLSRYLPDYMVPSTVIFLNSLPLNANGKVDRQALPVPEGGLGAPEGEYVAPRDSTERALAAMWGELLSLDKVGVDDNFFEIGGHSLLGTQFVSRVRSAYDVDLPLRELFASPTIAKMARQVRVLQDANRSKREKIEMALEKVSTLSPEELQELLDARKANSGLNQDDGE